MPANRKPSASVHHLNYALLQIQSTVAGTSLPVSEEIRSLDVIIDRRLTFESHISGVVKSCNYHLWALRHIRHLLPFSTAQTLACSLILSRLDYCNAVLYGCWAGAVGRLQRVQNWHAITAVATLVTLAASATAACLQSITYHIQSHNHVNSIIPQWSANGSHPCWTNLPFVDTSTAHSSLRRIQLRQTILLLCLANCVELSAYSDVQSSSLQATFKSRLKTHNICLTLLLTINPNCDVA